MTRSADNVLSSAYDEATSSIKTLTTATFTTGDIEIGAVEIKNGTDDTRAKVNPSTAIAESDNAIAAHDPTIGLTSDAAVITDTTGTANGKLRGLVKWAFERMPASLGQKTAANSLPVVLASDQSSFTVDTELTTADLDSGAGTDTRAVVGLVLSASGGGVLATGSTANGLAADVTRLPAYTAPVSGELAGATSATQLPNVACRMVKLKAEYDNAGRVYLGPSGVTKADGTTDTTTGLQLSAGEETGWVPIDNLNRLYRICDNAGDDLTYVALA